MAGLEDYAIAGLQKAWAFGGPLLSGSLRRRGLVNLSIGLRQTDTYLKQRGQGNPGEEKVHRREDQKDYFYSGVECVEEEKSQDKILPDPIHFIF